jgi:hypothetical protein
MRKKYLRYLFKELKTWEHITYYRYIRNLRIFHTEKVTFIFVNVLFSNRLNVYYFYMPEKLYLGYDSFRIEDSRRYRRYLSAVKQTILKIEEDDIYRKYRITRQECTIAKREGR